MEVTTKHSKRLPLNWPLLSFRNNLLSKIQHNQVRSRSTCTNGSVFGTELHGTGLIMTWQFSFASTGVDVLSHSHGSYLRFHLLGYPTRHWRNTINVFPTFFQSPRHGEEVSPAMCGNESSALILQWTMQIKFASSYYGRKKKKSFTINSPLQLFMLIRRTANVSYFQRYNQSIISNAR